MDLLEFLASSVTIYTTILQMGQGSHILVFKDSSSTLVWMQKESFDPVNSESHDAVARWLGWTLVSNKKSLYSQHIKGTENIIADSLSRDFHMSDQTLKIIEHSTTIDSGIVPHQTDAQKRYILYIIASVILNSSNSITKATATKQSGNWYMWCTFLKRSVITDEFLGVIPQYQSTIIVSPFADSVQINRFSTTRKQILLHGNVKSAISDVSASFRTHLLSDQILDY